MIRFIPFINVNFLTKNIIGPNRVSLIISKEKDQVKLEPARIDFPNSTAL